MTIVTLFNKLLTNQYLNDSELTFELEVARSLVTISQTSWLSTLLNDSHNDEIHTAAELSYKQITLGKIFLKQQIPNEEALTKEEMSEKIIIYSQTLKRILVDGLPNKNTSTAKPTHVLEKSYKDLTRILENLPITQKEALTGIEDYITKKKTQEKLLDNNYDESFLSAEYERLCAIVQTSISEDKLSLDSKKETETVDLISCILEIDNRNLAIEFCQLAIASMDSITLDASPILGLMTFAFMHNKDHSDQYEDRDRISLLQNWCVDCQTGFTDHASCWEGSIERANFLGYSLYKCNEDTLTEDTSVHNQVTVLSESYAGNKIMAKNHLPETYLVQLATLAILQRFQNLEDTDVVIPQWQVDGEGKLDDETCKWVSQQAFNELYASVEQCIENPYNPELLIKGVTLDYMPIMKNLLVEIGFTRNHAEILLYTATFESEQNLSSLASKGMQHWAYIFSSALDTLTMDKTYRKGKFPDSFDIFSTNIQKAWLEPVYSAFDNILNNDPSTFAEYLNKNCQVFVIPPLRDMEQIKKCIDFFKHPKIIETVGSSHWELITCMDYEVLQALIPHLSVSICQKRDCKGFSLAHIGYHIPSNTFAYLVENMDDSCLGFQDDYGQNPLMGLVDTVFEGEQDEEILDKVKVLCGKMQPEYFHQRNKSNLSVLDESFICTIEQMIGQASTNLKNEAALSEEVFRYLIKTVPTTLFFSLDNDNKRTIEKVIAETQLPACKDFGVLMIDRLQNQDFDILTESGQSLLQLAIYAKNDVCAEAMIKKMNLQQLNFVDKDNKSAHDIAIEQNSSHLKECIESQINTLHRESLRPNEIMCAYDSGKHHKKRELFKKEVLDLWSWIKKPSNKEVSYDESDDGKGNRDSESQGLIKDTEKNIKSGKR